VCSDGLPAVRRPAPCPQLCLDLPACQAQAKELRS
jgi:hypothetical protein